jgi:hypothetical protein
MNTSSVLGEGAGVALGGLPFGPSKMEYKENPPKFEEYALTCSLKIAKTVLIKLPYLTKYNFSIFYYTEALWVVKKL